MRFLFFFLFYGISLFANDANSELCSNVNINCSDNKELKLIEYQNQIIKLVEDVSNVDTQNKLLKQKLEHNEDYYKKILEKQSKEFSIYIDVQKSNHNTVVDDLFYMFNIIVGLITLGILAIGFGLNFFGRRLLKRKIAKYIKEGFNEEITSQQINKLRENAEFNDLVKDIIGQQEESEEDIVDDPL